MSLSLFSTFLEVARGIPGTLFYATASFAIGLVIAVVILYAQLFGGRTSKLISYGYLSLFRGTPLLVQLSIIYFGMPLRLSVASAGLIAFSLNSAAYITEILRGGINGVDRGQYEALAALAVPNYKGMRDIIIPQALRSTLPSLLNEIINLVKESAIISTIGGVDIMRHAQLIAARNYTYFEPMLMAALCYYLIVLTLSTLVGLLENRGNRS